MSCSPSTAASDGLHGLRTSLLSGPMSMTTASASAAMLQAAGMADMAFSSASASTSASTSASSSWDGESVFSTFPESMLRALETASTSSARHQHQPAPAAPQTPSRTVPIVLMVPVTMDVAAPLTVYSSRAQHPALSRLLEEADVQTCWSPASTSSSVLVSRSSTAWALPAPAPAPRLPLPLPPAVADFPVSLPSFGERTAAAKRMASAAPGGPVTFDSGLQVWNAGNTQEVSFFHPLAQRKRKIKKGFCPFCKKNGESSRTYSSHPLTQNRADGSLVVTCPVLRRLRCEICGATGDEAHTRTHCPRGSEQIAVASILKNTPRRCDGSFRYIK